MLAAKTRVRSSNEQDIVRYMWTMTPQFEQQLAACHQTQ